MKAGWKTRMDERLYFEAKLSARNEMLEKWRLAQRRAEFEKKKAGAWINLSNPGQTRSAWEREQRAKGYNWDEIKTGAVIPRR